LVKNEKNLPKIKFWSKTENFGQKSNSSPKIEILVKNRKFWPKIELFIKNINFGQKLKILAKKIEFFVILPR